MRSIHFLKVLIVLTVCSRLGRAEYDPGGGENVAKPAAQANKQVQPSAPQELDLGQFVIHGRYELTVARLVVIRPVGPAPAKKPVKKPIRIRISAPKSLDQ
jgi:hypothetical protein